MNRRQALRLLGTAGLVLAAGPRAALAASADELAGQAQDALSAGDTDKALTLLLQAQSKDGRNDRVQALLGRAYFQRGDARTALTHFTLAVRLNPEDTLSRIMAETIRQFPLPPRAGQQEGSAPRESAALAGQAQAERQALLASGPSRPGNGPFRVLIDPGHGGPDIGAPGEGLRESDVALDLSLRLARILSATPDALSLSLTRTADIALPGWSRAALAGFYGADLLLSLHATRVPDPAAAGIVIFTPSSTPTDSLAREAALVENAAYDRQPPQAGRGGQDVFTAAVRRAAGGASKVSRAGQLAKALAAAWPTDSPLPGRGTAAGPFRLLAEADVPAVLIEAGFLSRPGDATVLAVPEKRQALAQGLATAVLAVAGSRHGGP